MSLFDQDIDTFTSTMLLNVDQLQKQLDKDEFQEDRSMAAFWVSSQSSGTKSEVQDDRSKSGNDTYADDADIRPIYDEKLMVEVQFFAIGQQQTEQLEISHEGRVDQYPEKCQVQSPMLDSTLDNQKTEYSKQSLENSSKNMPRFSSNDMVHNHYLDEAKKKTQERDRNSKTSVTPSARLQSTADGSKPKPRSNNQTPRSLLVSKSSCVTITTVPKADHSKSSSSFSDSKQFVCSTCHKCVFSAKYDACIIKLLKEVHSRAKIQSYNTKNSNKPIDQKGHTQKPHRQIFTRHRWIPTGKLFESCTSKVDSEPPHGSNVDIPNIHECKQTLDVSAGTSINVQKEQNLDLSADMIVMTSMIELESLFGPSFNEYFNGENQIVSKSFVVTAADASVKRQQQPNSTSSTSTLATTVTADGNFVV
ncbi:hypothetical protein Tco_0880861 [Tanacetum coccineum]